MKKLFSAALLLFVTLPLWSQGQVVRHDKAVFVTPKNEFMDSVRTEISKFLAAPENPRKQLQLDFAGLAHPTSAEEFKKYWHNKPLSQAMTGTCWCFSTTSFFESEIYRQTKREIKLSESTLYTGNTWRKPSALLSNGAIRPLAKDPKPTL